jgi:hypothetical protein
MNNPYISRGPVRTPDMFFGRTRELNEIAVFLSGDQSVSIVGPRKIGKTSLLFHLMRPSVWPELNLADDNLFVYLDCQVLGQGGHGEIFGQFAGEMAAALDERDLPPEPALEIAIDNPTRRSFEGALRKLNRRGLRVVLMLDAFERLSTNPELDVNFFNALRSAAGRYQLVFLTASVRPLIELTFSGRSQEILSSPFFNIFALLYLGLLPQEESYQLIREPVQNTELNFSPAIEEFLYTLVGGHPLALQLACFHAWELVDDTAEIEQRTRRELDAHFQYYWQHLTPAERETLDQVSDPAWRAANNTIQRGILRDLVQKCLLTAEGGGYRYPCRAWATFVAAQTPEPPSPAPTKAPVRQTHFGPYEVLERLGRGGMGQVYKGHHPRLDRTVAIKVLAESLAADEDFRRRFEREARAVAALKHPNIVQVFDFGDVDGKYYMVMEYLAGNDLGQFMAETGPLSLDQAQPLLQDVAKALDYAHAQGLLHRDVKPANIMLEPLTAGEQSRQRAILTDFGMVKLRAGKSDALKTGGSMGTPAYMAPEQIQGSEHIDHRADIYALGVTLYQMLTGRLPFADDNPAALVLAHLQLPPPDPRTLVPALSDSVAGAVLRALAKNPEQRYPTAGELVEALG